MNICMNKHPCTLITLEFVKDRIQNYKVDFQSKLTMYPVNIRVFFFLSFAGSVVHKTWDQSPRRPTDSFDFQKLPRLNQVGFFFLIMVSYSVFL